jgi:surfactin synthase thioesterase subunit
MQQVARISRGLRPDEKVDVPILQLLGEKDPVTTLDKETKTGWRPYTTSEVRHQETA